MKKLYRLLTSGMMMIAISPFGFADNITPDTCDQYLSSSDSAFYAAVSSNSSVAANTAQILNACSNANICTQINNVDNCAAILANRYFVSEYYAAANGNGASGGSYGATAQTINPLTKSADTNNNATAGAKNRPSKNDSTSIHWF